MSRDKDETLPHYIAEHVREFTWGVVLHALNNDTHRLQMLEALEAFIAGKEVRPINTGNRDDNL